MFIYTTQQALVAKSKKLNSLKFTVVLGLMTNSLWAPAVFADSCQQVIPAFNHSLPKPVDDQELLTLVQALNNHQIPNKYVTKQQAKQLGWHPGANLCAIAPLQGKSIGGDVFQNRQGQLPDKNGRTWQEADLNYHCGKRNDQRMLFSNDGLQFVTVDHYQSFIAVPTCQ